MSTRWLGGCTQVPSLPSSTWLAALGVPRRAEASGVASPDARSAPRWVVPSLQSLLKRNVEGVGFSIITLKTDAFRNRDINAVEVDVRVNDVPVHEDGLPPEHRRVANYPDAPFGHSFALQTLNFLGARGGCDVIRLALTPVFGDGRRGETSVAQLPYVALRDVAERTVPLGKAELKWTASYATPAREWRHIPFLHSYVFRLSGGEAAIAAATQAAEKDKSWLDQKNLSYEGRRIVGVIRPPRTLQRDGTAAFGLAAGLIQDNGQVRFTFSEPEAKKIGEFVRARRTQLPGGASVIERRSYVFQAVGGSRTVPGVCERA
jgi:hypothetical protein